MTGCGPHDAAISFLLSPFALLHLLLCAAMLAGIGALAYHLSATNLDPSVATLAAIAAPLSLVVWALWSPASSDFRMWIVGTFVVLVRVAMLFAVLVALFRLWAVGFAVSSWFAAAWGMLLVVPLAWLDERAISLRIARLGAALAERGAGPA